MKSLWVERRLDYDGSQLRSLFGYLDHGVLGDSIIGFCGACSVDFAHMVDGEDLLAKAEIAGSKMVHFIVEKFDQRLFAGVVLQRLLTCIVKEAIENLEPKLKGKFEREGDDLYFEKRKFSISIATLSPVSTLIHLAVNVSNNGTPVSTCALEEWGIAPQKFGAEVLRRFTREVLSVEEATTKVRWVK